MPPPIAPLDPRVEVVPQSGLVLTGPPDVSPDNGFTRVSVPLRNATGHDIAAQCVIDWYDAAGHTLSGLSTAPMRIAAAPYSATECAFVSPLPTTSRFTVQIVPSY